MGILYLIATPIGNLEDISARALRLLREAPLIAAEDTRHSRKLLSHYQITTKVISYHDFNKELRLDRILESLAEGDVALISDAGTPGLNDPGVELVSAAVEHGHQVVSIPGPTAPISALVSSGLPADRFLYLGYLPRKSKPRQDSLREISHLPFTLIFLETPHRIIASLKDLRTVLGNRRIAVARELTKMNEEIFRGDMQEAVDHFEAAQPRGEFTLVVAGCTGERTQWTESQVVSALKSQLDLRVPGSQISREVAETSGWQRRQVYNLLTKIKDGLL